MLRHALLLFIRALLYIGTTCCSVLSDVKTHSLFLLVSLKRVFNAFIYKKANSLVVQLAGEDLDRRLTQMTNLALKLLWL